jgi:hypothetical protein
MKQLLADLLVALLSRRLTWAVLLGLASVAFGAKYRSDARELARHRSIDRGSGSQVISSPDPDLYEWYREVGAWSIGFGLAVLAVSVGAWVAREPQTPATAPRPDAEARG